MSFVYIHNVQFNNHLPNDLYTLCLLHNSPKDTKKYKNHEYYLDNYLIFSNFTSVRQDDLFKKTARSKGQVLVFYFRLIKRLLRAILSGFKPGNFQTEI